MTIVVLAFISLVIGLVRLFLMSRGTITLPFPGGFLGLKIALRLMFNGGLLGFPALVPMNIPTYFKYFLILCLGVGVVELVFAAVVFVSCAMNAISTRKHA